MLPQAYINKFKIYFVLIVIGCGIILFLLGKYL